MSTEVGEPGESGRPGANGGAAGAAGGGAKTTPTPARAEPAPRARSGRGWKLATLLLLLLLAASLAGNALLLRGQRELESEATGLGMSLAEADARADRAERELSSLQGVVGNVHRGIVSLQNELDALATALAPAETVEPAAAAPAAPIEEPAELPADLGALLDGPEGDGPEDAALAPPEALDVPEEWGLADPLEVPFDELAADPAFDAELFEAEPAFEDALAPEFFETGPGFEEPGAAELVEADPAEELSVPAPSAAPADVFSAEDPAEPPDVAAPRPGVVAPAEPGESGILERAVHGTGRAAEQVRDVFSD